MWCDLSHAQHSINIVGLPIIASSCIVGGRVKNTARVTMRLDSCVFLAILFASLFLHDSVNGEVEIRELKIHLMPHTHCDVGYKKTFEGYFLTEVRPILLSMTAALKADASRRFIWSEVAYLQRWYEGPTTEQDLTAQVLFKSLVLTGQIELIDGGFTQHDDAMTTLAQQLQNMRTGHLWLRKHFNATPRVGWHPDSFGSTSLVPTLYRLGGFELMLHDRMNDAVKASLVANRSMEFIWHGSASLPANETAMLTHIMNGHTGYQGPVCFDWEPDQSPCPAVNSSTGESCVAVTCRGSEALVFCWQWRPGPMNTSSSCSRCLQPSLASLSFATTSC
jgi:hypothetical protein